jgi:hypothetical protein
MLLEVDGLSDGWEAGVHSDYEGRIGDLDGKAAGTDASRDFAHLWRRNAPRPKRGKKSTTATKPFRRVREIGYTAFRELLVEHFALEWKANRVVWPSRNGARKSR